MNTTEDSPTPAAPVPGSAAASAVNAERSVEVLGHELDNVLNGLLGMARLLRASDLNAEQDRWSRAIEQSGRQLRRLVSVFRDRGADPDGLSAGRPGAGAARGSASPSARASPIDGIDLLEQAVYSQVPLALAQGNRLLLDVDPGLPRYWRTDPCRLRQLLDNLLGNANKFTRDGEVLLRAARPGDVAAGRCLLLEVSDTGPGIDPRSVGRIFEPGSHGPGGGSGLGLFVCRRAAVALGGTVEVSAPAGGGAHFVARLPALLSAGATAPPPLTRTYQQLECRLELGGRLRSSVAGWLSRLGASWRDGSGDEPGRAGDRLVLHVSELPALGGPAPLLLFAPELGLGQDARRLAGPVTGSSLAPVLLELLLEWAWLSRDRRG